MKDGTLEITKFIPALIETRHKGLNGKIGVIGGSYEYTGAPFYAAISSTYAVRNQLYIGRRYLSYILL